MAEILQVENNPFFTISQVVDQQSYDFTFQWNGRDEAWWVEVGLTGEDPSLRTKITVGVDCFRPYRHRTGVPDRYFFMVDVFKTFGRADREGFANRFIPILLTEEEYNDIFVQT